MGSASNVGDATLRGFLYLDGTMYDLNDLTLGAPGYVITSAVAINDSGQIAADAITPSGQAHAVLLTPSAAPRCRRRRGRGWARWQWSPARLSRAGDSPGINSSNH